MTQHGSFPGRPRGRRARHEADLPEGEGYAATPPDEREFPDLPPIRPSQARARDARGQGDWQGQPRSPVSTSRRAGAGSPGRAATAADTRPAGAATGSSRSPASPGYGGTAAASTAAVSTAAAPVGPAQPGPGQAPWSDQDWQAQAPGQPPQARQAQPQQALQAQPQPGRSQQQWDEPQQGRQEEEVPSWAEPDSVEAFSARWHRRGLDSRDDRRTDRRKRRRTLFAIGGALAVVIAVAVYFLGFSAAQAARPTWASARW